MSTSLKGNHNGYCDTFEECTPTLYWYDGTPFVNQNWLRQGNYLSILVDYNRKCHRLIKGQVNDMNDGCEATDQSVCEFQCDRVEGKLG